MDYRQEVRIRNSFKPWYSFKWSKIDIKYSLAVPGVASKCRLVSFVRSKCGVVEFSVPETDMPGDEYTFESAEHLLGPICFERETYDSCEICFETQKIWSGTWTRFIFRGYMRSYMHSIWCGFDPVNIAHLLSDSISRFFLVMLISRMSFQIFPEHILLYHFETLLQAMASLAVHPNPEQTFG